MIDNRPGTTQRSSGGTADVTDAPWVDVTLAVVVSGIAAWVWIEAGTFPAADDPARNPAVLPQVIAVMLWMCALALAVRSGLRRVRASRTGRREDAPRETAVQEPAPQRPAPPETAPQEPAPREQSPESSDESRFDLPQLAVVTAFVVALLIYVWGAFELGYLVSSWLFLTAVTCALSGRPTLRTVAVTTATSAVCSVAIWLIFIHALGVHLPPTWAP